MTIEPVCYVCGKEQPCIDGLCPECTMNELFHPGAAFAATFGAVCLPVNNDAEDGRTAQLLGDAVEADPDRTLILDDKTDFAQLRTLRKMLDEDAE